MVGNGEWLREMRALSQQRIFLCGYIRWDINTY